MRQQPDSSNSSDGGVRWSGSAKNDGYTVHVGTDDDYLALYRSASDPAVVSDAGEQLNGLNHTSPSYEPVDSAT